MDRWREGGGGREEVRDGWMEGWRKGWLCRWWYENDD